MIKHLLELQIVELGYGLEEGPLAFSECIYPGLNIFSNVFLSSLGRIIGMESFLLKHVQIRLMQMAETLLILFLLNTRIA